MKMRAYMALAPEALMARPAILKTFGSFVTDLCKADWLKGGAVFDPKKEDGAVFPAAGEHACIC